MAKKKIEKEVYTYNCPFCKKQHTDSNGCPDCNKVKAPVVELVSYTIKAVIPTGSYANIQPEIIVKAKNLGDAENYVRPHIDKLFAQYLNKGDSPMAYAVSQQKVMTYVPKDNPSVTIYEGASGVSGTPGVQTATASTAPYVKAEQAIGSCLSLDALHLIESQISKSVKLNHDEKFALLKLVEIKATELNK